MASPDAAATSNHPRVTLVTGANTGIGLAACRALAQAGCVVLLGSRNSDRGRTATELLRSEGLDVSLQMIDITDQNSVDATAVDIAERFGRLDVLVNNAAIKTEFSPSVPSETPLQVVRDTYETNVFGTMRVTQAMVTLLRNSPAGRIVNVSSGLGSMTQCTLMSSPYSGAPFLGYSTSKAALNSITVQFANEFRHTTIKVNSVDPGSVATPMNPRANRTPAQAVAPIVWLATLGPDGPTGGFFDENGVLPW